MLRTWQKTKRTFLFRLVWCLDFTPRTMEQGNIQQRLPLTSRFAVQEPRDEYEHGESVLRTPYMDDRTGQDTTTRHDTTTGTVSHGRCRLGGEQAILWHRGLSPS